MAKPNGACHPESASPQRMPPQCSPGLESLESAREEIDPEIRFVYMLPRQKTSRLTEEPSRRDLRAQLQTYFTGNPERFTVGYDLLKGRALHRLTNFASDFSSDLLLTADSPWPRWKCGRLAISAPCSVWLVPPAWAPVFRRVVVPVDFSPRDAYALRMALELMSRDRAKCLVLHAYKHEGRFAGPARDQVTRRALPGNMRRLWHRSTRMASLSSRFSRRVIAPILLSPAWPISRALI